MSSSPAAGTAVSHLARARARCRFALALALTLEVMSPAAAPDGAPGAGRPAPPPSVRFVFPTPWGVVRELGDGLRIRVDATDFQAVWLDSSCTLSLLAQGLATETDRMNASFHMESSLAYGFHKLGAMVRDWDGEVLATATVIFIYAPPELGVRVPVPTPVNAVGQEGSTLSSSASRCKPSRRVVRGLLQKSGLSSCADRVKLIEGHGGDGGVIIDVGTHDGVELSSLAAVARKVVAIEANPHKARAIEARMKEQGLWHKVVLYSAAAGNETGSVGLHVPLGEAGSEMDSVGSTFFYTGNEKSIEVPSVRLDDIVQERVQLLKIDAQGHELQVLHGADRLLSSYGVDLLVLEFAPRLLMSNGVDPAQLLHYIYNLGYQCFSCPGDGNQQSPPALSWFRDLEMFDFPFSRAWLPHNPWPLF
jgi:FkbM family methyltransferase